MKRWVFIVCLLLELSVKSSYGYAQNTPMFFTGAIQFPETLQEIPQVFIGTQGCRIQGNCDLVTKRLTYTVSKPRHIQTFWVAVSQHLLCDTTEQNTVACWRVDTNKPYKFYAITRVLDSSVTQDAHPIDNKPQTRWEIVQYDLTPYNGMLPDDVIMIYYDAELISGIKGGGAFELPTLCVRDDVVSLLGSTEAFKELSGKLELAALDLRLFFCPVDEYIIRHDAHAKTVIVLTTT